MIYDMFAYYYDQMMADIDYDIFLDLVLKYIPKDKYILDAGCGTGIITMALKKMGYQISGLDISNDMLMILRHKMDMENVYFPLYENDLCDELPKNSFGAVISFLDVINYIIDYKKALRNIYDSLIPGGIFIFDISTVNFFKELIGYTEDDDYDDFSYHWEIEAGKEENSVVHHLAIKNKHGKVFIENHYQKTYDDQVYLDYLKSLGFRVIKETGFDNLKTFFICYK